MRWGGIVARLMIGGAAGYFWGRAAQHGASNPGEPVPAVPG
jgi:hypothetical protein